MRRTSHARVGAMLLCAGAALWLGGCGDEEVVNVTPKPPISVSIATAPDTADAGGEVSVKAQVSGTPVDSLVYNWYAPGGRFFDASAESTTWVAASEPDLYPLSVVVTDGVNVAIDTVRVRVGAYVPTVEPYYEGVATCAICHTDGPGGDQYPTWAISHHAMARQALVSVGAQNADFCLGCHTVGTRGLVPDPDNTIDNGGFLDTRVPRLYNVQCENCHGPGSGHPPRMFFTEPDTTLLSAALCGQCHHQVGSHPPIYDQWLQSAHNGIVASPAGRGGCVACHNGMYSGEYLDDPAAFVAPATVPAGYQQRTTCQVCHEVHGATTPGELRQAAVTPVTLPGDIVLDEGGLGHLCMNCHNSRESEADAETMIQEGSTHFGPHHGPQADMIAGVNAYEAIAPGFAWASPTHLGVENTCVTCHLNPPPEGVSPMTAAANHTFAPQLAACMPCHGPLADFDEVMARYDYDGDGVKEGLQIEVTGLLDLLMTTILDASTGPAARAALEEDFGNIGDLTISTVDQRKAGYNWIFVSNDASEGVHDAFYTVQVLQQSILYLDPAALPNAVIAKKGH